MKYKICSKCGAELPLTFEYFGKRKDSSDGFQCQCKECRNKAHRLYAAAHKEELKSYQKQYRESHKGEKKVYMKEYHKNYYAKNKAAITKKHIKYNRIYIKTPHGRELDRAKKYRRKALDWLNGGSYTPEEWEECLDFFENKCAYTGKDIADDCTVDHIVPMSKGGTSFIYNLCPCCGSANFSKCNKDMEKWFRAQKYFSEERLNKIYDWIELAKVLF